MAAGTSRRDVTAFDYTSYVLWDQVDPAGGTTGATPTYAVRKDGGATVPLFSGTAVPVWADIFGVDASAADQAIQQATTNLPRAIGPVVGWIANGRAVFGPNCFATEFGVLTVGASRLFIQVSGIAIVTTDGASTVAIGDVLVPSGATAGKVVTNNSPTVGTILGRALQSSLAAATQIRMLIQRG